MDDEGENGGGKQRTSYYAEENEKLLNLLITNCEPILSELVTLIDHFNSYNNIHRVIEKSQLFSPFSQAYYSDSNAAVGGTMGTLEDISIADDCRVLDSLVV